MAFGQNHQDSIRCEKVEVFLGMIQNLELKDKPAINNLSIYKINCQLNIYILAALARLNNCRRVKFKQQHNSIYNKIAKDAGIISALHA